MKDSGLRDDPKLIRDAPQGHIAMTVLQIHGDELLQWLGQIRRQLESRLELTRGFRLSPGARETYAEPVVGLRLVRGKLCCLSKGLGRLRAPACGNQHVSEN